MINLLIQALTLISGLLVNFFVPAIFGLSEYGLFLQANILVFLFHKLTDIACEPLLSQFENRLVFPFSALVGLGMLSVFWLVNEIHPLGDPRLLAAMLMSSSVMLSMYANRRLQWIVAYLVAFNILFLSLAGLNKAGLLTVTIRDVLFWTNLGPAAIAILVLLKAGAARASGREIVSGIRVLVRSFPTLLGITLVFNLLTNVLPFAVSRVMPAHDVGLFRVNASVLQSATSLFPINTKAILASFVLEKNKAGKYKILIGVSLLYFSVIGIFAVCVALGWPSLEPYLALICSLPALYWCVLSERYLLASGSRRAVLAANLGIGIPSVAIMFVVTDIRQALFLFSIALSAYLLALQIISRRKLELAGVPLVWVAAVSPAMILLMQYDALMGGVYLGIAAAIAIIFYRVEIGKGFFFRREL